MGNTVGTPENKDIIIKESNNIFMKKGEVSLDSNEELTIELLKKINQLERRYENINKDICNKISITIDNTLNKMSINRLREMNKMIVGQDINYELRISEYVTDNDEFIADELKEELLNIFEEIKNNKDIIKDTKGGANYDDNNNENNNDEINNNNNREKNRYKNRDRDRYRDRDRDRYRDRDRDRYRDRNRDRFRERSRYKNMENEIEENVENKENEENKEEIKINKSKMDENSGSRLREYLKELENFEGKLNNVVNTNVNKDKVMSEVKENKKQEIKDLIQNINKAIVNTTLDKAINNKLTGDEKKDIHNMNINRELKINEKVDSINRMKTEDLIRENNKLTNEIKKRVDNRLKNEEIPKVLNNREIKSNERVLKRPEFRRCKKDSNKCILTKSELCIAIRDHYITRLKLIKYIKSKLPYRKEDGTYEGGVCYNRYKSLKNGTYCLNPNALLSLDRSKITTYIDNLTFTSCKNAGGYFKVLSEAEKNKILKQDNEYSRRYYDILLRVQIIHKELLKDLFNILDMLEMSLTINNSKLNELILVTINKVNEAELLCKEFFRDAIISILQNDFK